MSCWFGQHRHQNEHNKSDYWIQLAPTLVTLRKCFQSYPGSMWSMKAIAKLVHWFIYDFSMYVLKLSNTLQLSAIENTSLTWTQGNEHISYF